MEAVEICKGVGWSGGDSLLISVVCVSVYERLIQVAFSNEKSTGISGMWEGGLDMEAKEVSV